MALRKRGFWVGVFLFFAIIFLPPPSGLTENAWFVAAVALLMVTWWATEAIPIPVTSLLPLALFPILGVTSIDTAALPYANKNIYLFLGGFLIALSIERSGLHKRLALMMIKKIGSDGPKLIGGFMIVSALISMWVMNTSTTLMLLPIGLAICSVVAKTVPNMSEKDKSNFDKALLLSIAYAATIGGMSTLVGTAPNIAFASFMSENVGQEISFVGWMKLGVPVSICMLALAWLILTKIIYPVNFSTSEETRNMLSQMLNEMGPISKDEFKVGVVFFIAAGLWMFRSLIDNYVIGLTDAGIAILVAISLFIIPSSGRNGELLSWEQSSKLPWGLLLLFGGGLSLGVQINDTGLGEWIGQSVSGLKTVPLIILVMAIAALIIFLTEVTSNLATTNAFLPVFLGVAIGFEIAPVVLLVPVALAASCAFMLPVATPPNAIVYGCNKFKIVDMMRAGFFINIAGIFVVMIFAYYFADVIL
ncbi:MAG: anion transporter [Flavobacteriaceae bacterium]|nr:anion transporter [Flavobacteriaceae bacterium]